METSLLTERHKGIYSVEIRNRLGIDSFLDLRRQISVAVASGFTSVLVDLTPLKILDRFGIEQLALIKDHFSSNTCEFGFVISNHRILRLLKATRHASAMNVYRSVCEAQEGLAARQKLRFFEKGFYLLVQIRGEFSIMQVKPLRALIEKSLDAGYTHFVFDLSQCRMVTSVGSGILMNLQGQLRQVRGGVLLLGLNPGVREQLDAANILYYLREYETIEDVERTLVG